MDIVEGGQNTGWTEYRVGKIQVGRVHGGQNTECAEYRLGRIQSLQSTGWVEYRLGRVQGGKNTAWAEYRVGSIQSGQSTGWAKYRVGRIQGFLILYQLIDVFRSAVTICSKNTQHQFSLILAEDAIHPIKRLTCVNGML